MTLVIICGTLQGKRLNFYLFIFSLLINFFINQFFFLINSVDIKEYDPIWSHEMSLKVNGSGQIIHAYVNGNYIGNK